MNKMSNFISGKIKSFAEKYKLPLTVIFFIFFVIDIFLVKFIYDLIVLFLFGFLIFIIWLYRWQNHFLVELGVILLLPAALFSIFKNYSIAEKFALWSYLLFTISVTKEILGEIRKNG